MCYLCTQPMYTSNTVTVSVCVCTVFYVQRLTMLQGFSPPVQRQPWKWLALCLPAGVWSHVWVTAAPCTLDPAGELEEEKTPPGM